MIEQILKVYGLKRNPFDESLCQELYPQSENDLDQLYAKVEGFGEQITDIEAWLNRYSKEVRLPAMLVCGATGSGRSSVANYVIDRFFRSRGANPSNVSKIVIRIKDHDPVIPVRDGLGELYRQMIKDVSFVSSADHEPLRRLFEQHVLVSNQNSTPVLYNIIFDTSVETVLKQTNKSQPSPVIVFDEVRSVEQVDSGRRAFDNASILVFITSIADVQRKFKDLVPGGLVVNLRDLTVSDVEELIRQRWSALSGTREVPFDTVHIRGVFTERPRNFQAVANLLAAIFSVHFDELKQALAKGDHFKEGPIPISEVTAYKAAYAYADRVAGRQVDHA